MSAEIPLEGWPSPKLFFDLCKEWVREEAVEVPVAFVLTHRPADRHHQRDGCIDLLIGPLFGWIQGAARYAYGNPSEQSLRETVEQAGALGSLHVAQNPSR